METSFTITVAVGVIAVMIQSISGQCIGNNLSEKLSYTPELSSSGSFIVRSVSPIAPTGVAILSERLVMEGPLMIDGHLPFLGSVAFDGAVPSKGAGSVSYSCGGNVGITSEIAPNIPAAVPYIDASAIGALPLFKSAPLFGSKPLLGAGTSPLLAGPATGAERLSAGFLGLSTAFASPAALSSKASSNK